MRARTTRGLAALLIATSGLVLGVANPAQAWEGPGYDVKVVHVSSRATDQVNWNQVLWTCSGTPGVVCSLSETRSATRTISVDFNVTRAFVASKIGISSSTTQSIGVSCTSTLTSTKRTLRAYPRGTRITYRIEKKYYDGNGRYIGSDWSGTLTAFNPSGFHCVQS